MADPTDNPALPADEVPRDRHPEHWLLLSAAIVVPIAFVVLGMLSPDDRGFGTHEKLGLPPCGMMEYTGVPCPGCGVTTSVSLFANGRFVDSFVNQPFGFAFAILSIVFSVWAFVQHFKKRDLFVEFRALKLRYWGLAVGLVAAVAWVYKIVQVS